MMEHLEFWTSADCPPMSQEDIDLVKHIADLLGVKIFSRLHMENEKPEMASMAAGMN
jgi:hypothetical protein